MHLKRVQHESTSCTLIVKHQMEMPCLEDGSYHHMNMTFADLLCLLTPEACLRSSGVVHVLYHTYVSYQHACGVGVHGRQSSLDLLTSAGKCNTNTSLEHPTIHTSMLRVTCNSIICPLLHESAPCKKPASFKYSWMAVTRISSATTSMVLPKLVSTSLTASNILRMASAHAVNWRCADPVVTMNNTTGCA